MSSILHTYTQLNFIQYIKMFKDIYFIYFLKLFYCCSSTVVCITPDHFPRNPSHPHRPPLLPPTLGFVCVSFIVVPENPSLLSPPLPLSPPHPCGYCYNVLNFNVSGYILFAFFLLLIVFQLKVRSYGICPSPPGLFHLA